MIARSEIDGRAVCDLVRRLAAARRETTYTRPVVLASAGHAHLPSSVDGHRHGGRLDVEHASVVLLDRDTRHLGQTHIGCARVCRPPPLHRSRIGQFRSIG